MTRHEAYWMGYRHGQRLADHRPLENQEPGLRLELHLAGRQSELRAWYLGELRGYRNRAHDAYREIWA